MNALPEKNREIPVALALGGNLGDVAATFRLALRALEAGGVAHLRMAGLSVTAPEDCAPGTPDFVNSAATGFWRGSPEALLTLARQVEIALGRPAEHDYHASRTLDVDLILFGDQCIDTPQLVVPHPAARRRRFVLEPLAEIAGDWVFPDDGTTVAEALARLA